MSGIGSSVIPRPTAGTADFHLFAASRDRGIVSLVYVPLGPSPALTVDVLRLDAFARSAAPLETMARRWLADYASFADGAQLSGGIVSSSVEEVLICVGFVHPMIGNHHTVVRWIRRPARDCAVQLIHKLDPLTDAEIEERVRYLGSCTVPDDLSSPEYTRYATEAQRQSQVIGQLAQDSASGPKLASDLDRFQSMLAAASPMHYAQHWASLARLFSRCILEQGSIDKLDAADTYLRRAVVTFYDQREDPFIDQVLYRSIKELGDILMLRYSGSRPANVARAAELYSIAANRRRQADPDAGMVAEVMASLASALADPESEAPLDALLPEEIRRELRDLKKMDIVVDALQSYGDRLAYIARRKDRSLFRDACAAADMVQVLVERAAFDGGLSFDSVLGPLVNAFDRQLAMEKGYYGFDGVDFDHPVPGAGSVRTTDRPRLAYLRPLGTSRRVRLANEFGSRYRELVNTEWPVPEVLTLEGALHIALKSRFSTEALGGPIDVLGMKRGTALFKEQASAREAWQAYVSILIADAAVILVLLRDSAGLLWEMSEIARQDARGKVIFIMAPNQCGHPAPDSLLDQVRVLGFALPAESAINGFLMLDATGRVERKLAFESLWNGELLAAAVERSHRPQAV